MHVSVDLLQYVEGLGGQLSLVDSWCCGYIGSLVKIFRVGRYADIHTYSGIHIQILVGQPENSGISGIPI